VSMSFVSHKEQLKAVEWGKGGRHTWRAQSKGNGLFTALRCCRNCLQNKAGQRCCSALLVTPWVVAVSFIAVSSAAIVRRREEIGKKEVGREAERNKSERKVERVESVYKYTAYVVRHCFSHQLVCTPLSLLLFPTGITDWGRPKRSWR